MSRDYEVTLKGREILITTIRLRADSPGEVRDLALKKGARIKRELWQERWVADVGILEIKDLTPPEPSPPPPPEQLRLPETP